MYLMKCQLKLHVTKPVETLQTVIIHISDGEYIKILTLKHFISFLLSSGNRTRFLRNKYAQYRSVISFKDTYYMLVSVNQNCSYFDHLL